MQPPAPSGVLHFVLLLTLALGGRPTLSLLVVASGRGASAVNGTPQVVEIPAGTGKECLSEAGAYYGSDFPPSVHANASSAEECCRKCHASGQCNIWNWCGAAEGCLFPNILRDADGNIGVPFRTCDLKNRPVYTSGTTPMPPETVRTGDMAAWTSGIPLSTRLLKTVPGYDLYQGVQMPFGPASADFACLGSDTSKAVCELPGDVTAAQQNCDKDERCQGFQFCFLSTVPSSNAVGLIRLKGGVPSGLNLTTAIFNPYCSIYVSENPERTSASNSSLAGVPSALRRALLQQGAAAAPVTVAANAFNPLMGQTGSSSGAVVAVPASAMPLSGSTAAARRPGTGTVTATASPQVPPAAVLPRPAVPAAAPGTELDALLGAGSGSGGTAAELTPSAAAGANFSSASKPKGFDQYTPSFVGAASAGQVTQNSADYASGVSSADPSVPAGVGSGAIPDTITPADGVSDMSSYRTSPSSSEDGYNRTIQGAEVLVPLGFHYPMQIFPGSTFRYRTCSANGSVAFLRTDLMQVPSTTQANAEAYAIHTWVKVPFQSNVTCNHTCVYKLVDDAYFNMEDTTIARARPAYVTTDPFLAQAPIADYGRAANGSRIAAPLYYIPPAEVANTTTERGLRFHMLTSNTTSYMNELTRLYYYVSQIALGSKRCSAGFPGLKMAVDYIQSVLQEQVTLATGQDYGSFATLNGIPLAMDFITNSDITAGARRVYGQSCLTETNTLYQGQVLVAGGNNMVNTAEECCRSCWELGGLPGPPPRSALANATAKGGSYIAAAPAPGVAAAWNGPPCNAWTFCSSPIGCRVPGSTDLTEQGFCELKFSEDVARHNPVAATRAAAGFVSGRTTAVLPKDAPNLFGLGSI